MCVLLRSLFDLPVALSVFYLTVPFSLLTCFLFATTRWGCHEKNWAYLAFELMHKVFPCSYRPQVRNSVAVRRNSKVFKYKFVTN